MARKKGEKSMQATTEVQSVVKFKLGTANLKRLRKIAVDEETTILDWVGKTVIEAMDEWEKTKH